MPFTCRFFPHVIQCGPIAPPAATLRAPARIRFEPRMAHCLDMTRRMALQVRGNHLRRVARRVARAASLLFPLRGERVHISGIRAAATPPFASATQRFVHAGTS